MYKKRNTNKRRKTHKRYKLHKKRKTNKRRYTQKGGTLVPFNMEDYISQAHAFYNNTSENTEGCVFPCDNVWCGKNSNCVKFKRIPLNIEGNIPEGLEGCENNDGVNRDDETKYFTDYQKNLSYLTEKYEKYFSLKYNDPDWTNFIDIIQEGLITSGEEKVILGPGELLIPFVKKGFLYLAHKDWRPNINFNYIIQILYKLRKFLMIIPTANTVMDQWFSLISGCSLHGSEDAFKRVTLSELLLLKALQNENYIDIKTIDVNVTGKNIIKKGNYYEMLFRNYKLYSEKGPNCADPSIIVSCYIKSDFVYEDAIGSKKISPVDHPSFKFHMLYITPTETFDSIIPDDYKETFKKWVSK